MEGGSDNTSLPKRNLLFIGYTLLIHDGFACLLFRQSSGPGCDVASCYRDFLKSLFIHPFKW